MKKFDVVIIGAGTAGLTARREVAKVTDNYCLIDKGPLGTTCARVGCMPSKVLIQVANDFSRRKVFASQGIIGAEHLSLDGAQVMAHVRLLRDRFVSGVMGDLKRWQDKLVIGQAKFLDAHHIVVNGEKIYGDKIIVAAGTRPVIPENWKAYRQKLLTTDEIFELETLPSSIAVFGLGVIGAELGLALTGLGIDTRAFTIGQSVGGLTDPILQKYVNDSFSHRLPIHWQGGDIRGLTQDGIQVEADGELFVFEKVLLSLGRTPNLDLLDFEKTGVSRNQKGLPRFDENDLSLVEADHIFLAGDVNGTRPVLHEAADEGMIAGFNAVNPKDCFKRRTPLYITFTEPNIATIGKRHQELCDGSIDFVIGEVSFEGQGRSLVKNQAEGLLHVYAAKKDGRLLGAELFSPDGEHLAHLLAWAISLNMTVFEVLSLPFYHPVVEEGLRTALRSAAKQVGLTDHSHLYRCEDPPIR